MGTRLYIKMHKDDKEKFPRKVFGKTSWKTYGQVAFEAKSFGAGLRALGLEPLPSERSREVIAEFKPIAGPHTLVIFEETCPAWMTACLGAMGQSVVVATSYATLGLPAVAEAVNETGAPAILCNYRDVARLAKMMEGSCPELRTIIYTRNCVEAESPEHPESMGRLTVLSMDKVMQLGEQKKFPFVEPEKESVALIMYTSGSTGKPKGVMLTHRSIVASVSGLEGYFLDFSKRATSQCTQEIYLAYLPLAHILEFSAEISMLVHGAKLGYSDPKTIASAGAYRLLDDGTLNGEPTGFGNNPPGGIQEFAPTLMAAVPKIWDILKKGVEDKIGKGSGVVKTIFQAAFCARSAALQQGRDCPLLGLLFKKVGSALGGRIKLAISGGGPISSDIQNFIRVAMKFNLVQGYGLTETCSGGTIQHWDSVADGVAGAPITSLKMRLKDCDQKEVDGSYTFVDRTKRPYLASDTRHLGMPCRGRGEVWMKGGNISSGYYLKPAETRKEFDADGWFHTGDVGVWLPDGNLKIVDRLKNLVKLKGGEYVALESMESTYAQSAFVNGKNGGIMCYADGDMDKPVALVQVNDYELKKWAGASGVQFGSVEELCKNEAAAKMVLENLNSIGKNTLGANEALAAVALLPGTGAPDSTGEDAPWTSENGFLTAANKLARNVVKEGFSASIATIKPLAIR